MFYHKVYMNQIHSSSLLCQLASMWKNQVLCDAVIKTGNTVTKAHRVVLVAACPMLHSMKNASTGSNLEVRLAADISQEAITAFLQYLYEGFMMLTEANCKDVEKIARVLQVDSVLKCCADFYKCLHSGNGYEYSFHDNVEFRHVRASDMLKVHERSKRLGESQRPESPASKRMRSYRSASSDQSWQTDHASGPYSGATDPWDRVPRDGTQSSLSRVSHPGVIDMVEDSVEIVHTEPAPDPGGRRETQRTTSLPHDRMAISVASEISPSSDVQIIDTSYPNTGSSSAQEDSISVIGSYTAPSHASMPTSSTGQRSHMSPRFQAPPAHKHIPSQSPHLVSQSPPRLRPSMTSSSAKPFAAGSASQTMRGVSPTVTMPSPSATQESPVLPSPVSLWRSQSAEILPPDKSPTSTRSESKVTSDTEVMSDISIIKVETGETVDPSHDDDPNLTSDPGDPITLTEDASNEGSNLSGDKSLPQWLSDSMKEHLKKVSSEEASPAVRRVGGVEMCNYVLVDFGDQLPEGYVRLDEEEKVCVPSSWLTMTLRYCTGKPASFTIKKLLDGFLSPWECKYGGTSAYRNTPYEPVFNALMLFGIKYLNIGQAEIKQALNEKLYFGRKKYGVPPPKK